VLFRSIRAYALARLAGGEPRLPPLPTRRWREVSVRPPPGAKLRIDGELMDGIEPAELTVSTGDLCLEVLIPNES